MNLHFLDQGCAAQSIIENINVLLCIVIDILKILTAPYNGLNVVNPAQRTNLSVGDAPIRIN